jgi:YidC/Oxa1 family membrane protein insertase
MDKRFILGLLLIGLVVIITPILFPSPQRPPTVTPLGGDSVHARPTATDTQVRAKQAPSPAPSVRADSLPNATASLPAPPVAGDTVVISTATTRYQFSTVGAMPIGVELRNYRDMSPRDGQVELTRPGTPLVNFRLLVGSDTIPVDHFAFSVDSSTATAAGANTLTFRTSLSGAAVAEIYTFVPDRYLMRVRGEVRGMGAANAALLVSLPDGLRSNEADSTNDQRSLALVFKPEKEDVESYSFRKLAKLDSSEAPVRTAAVTWVASKSKYFLVALIADQRPFAGATLAPPGAARTPPSQSAVVYQPLASDGGFAFQVYTGPQEWERLAALGHDFTSLNSYGGPFSPIIQPFMVIIMRVLLWMHSSLALAYGWVVIIFGVGLRVLLWPLYQSSMRASLRMQRIQPELQALQQKYKKNPEKQQQEIMRLYKEHGMSPFSSLGGCLPLLIPAPILYALYYVFENTIAFRGVPFLWMTDIAQKDPYYILPVLMGISMFVLSWIGLRTAPPSAQTKMMGYFFPVLMTVFFLKFPAGLNLYYAVQNIAALPQQWLIAKERAKAGIPAPKPKEASLARR